MSQNNKTLLRRFAELVTQIDHIDDSLPYQWYLRLRHPKHYEEKRREEAFYRKLIMSLGSDLVFDIGANEGNKAAIFAKLAKRVVCLEPSPKANAALRRRFKSSRTVHIINAGVGSKAGIMSLNVYDDDGPYDTFSEKWMNALRSSDGQLLPRIVPARVESAQMTTLDLLIDQQGLPSYIKVDVEGFECSVLEGLTKQIRAISIECNLPLFESETLACIQRLIKIHASGIFNYCTTEPPSGFSSAIWLSAEQIEKIVRSRAHSFMEIYFIADPQYAKVLSE